MKTKCFFIIVVAFFILFIGCEKDPMIKSIEQFSVLTPNQNSQKKDSIIPIQHRADTCKTPPGTVLFEFNDFDGNVYHAIKIGNQIWSHENLKVAHYNDGTLIPCIQSELEWRNAPKGAHCHYDNLESNSKLYGLLYNCNAVITGKIAPKGWHVATYDDWNELLVFIGNRPFPYISDVGSLVDPIDWRNEPFYSIFDYEVICTNSTGFSALPNGYRGYLQDVKFDCIGYQSSWWTADGHVVYLDQTFGIFERNDIPKFVGAGIRIVKDK